MVYSGTEPVRSKFMNAVRTQPPTRHLTLNARAASQSERSVVLALGQYRLSNQKWQVAGPVFALRGYSETISY